MIGIAGDDATVVRLTDERVWWVWMRISCIVGRCRSLGALAQSGDRTSSLRELIVVMDVAGFKYYYYTVRISEWMLSGREGGVVLDISPLLSALVEIASAGV